MTHFASINVRSRRVLTRNAVLRSVYSRISQIALSLHAASTALHHSALSPPLCLPHSSRKKQRRSKHIPIEIP
jgi:hypothetical protein